MPIAHKISPCAKRTVQRLQDAGYEAYIVGGAVRDLLLGREPKDFDIATSAAPEEVKAVFGRSCRIIGRRFRLAHVYGDHDVLEVSTYRREPTLEERRSRPDDRGLMVWNDNHFGNLEQDARRRDFTVNALFFDPFSNENPVVDWVDGLKDLEAGIVRTIGDSPTRLAEDPVRMLRALKLVGQYNFKLDPPLEEAIRNLAPRLAACSVARLLEELYKILQKPWSEPTLNKAYEFGLLQSLMPAVAKDWPTPCGDRIRRLMTERDALLADGSIYPSRVTGMATLIIPHLYDAFANDEDDASPLWTPFEGFANELRHEIRAYFQPLPVSQFSCAKLRDTLLLLPELFDAKNARPLRFSPEYPRARDVFRVLVTACGLDPELVEALPAPGRRPRSRNDNDEAPEASPRPDERRQDKDSPRGRSRGRRRSRSRRGGGSAASSSNSPGPNDSPDSPDNGT